MSANFTPSMGSIKDMKPFKFWCQKVLPTVYDDSLSYYELLCKVVQYLNDNVDNINLLNDNVTNLYNAYVALQEYVNNYFDQNFPELVSNKLDEMAEDGTLTALIKTYIDPYFEEKSAAIDFAFNAQDERISDAIENQNASIDLLDTQMTQFIADHAGLVTETVLWSGTGSGAGFLFNLSDDPTNYNYIDVHYQFTSMSTGTKQTYEGGVRRYNSQDFADSKCMLTIPIANGNTSDIGVSTVLIKKHSVGENRYELDICDKVTTDVNGFQLEVVTSGSGGISANDPSCGGITKIVGVKNTQNDQEVINARIGYDGTDYSTLGEAIRTQVRNLNNSFNNALDEKASVSYVGDYVLLDTESGGAVQRYSVPSQTAFDALKEQVESGAGSGESIPSNVRQAMVTLFNSALYKDLDLTGEKAVIMSWASEITGITISQSTASITGANTVQLVATTEPSGGVILWTSSNTAVATVSNNGLVTGVGNGNATITASCGNLKATCSVAVSGFATLSSISAVYTPTGTVYTSDSLDSLKDDLVVTALYSDSSTRILDDSDYTLSGLLQTGPNTIVVSYGGKTTTFTVTAIELIDLITETGSWTSARTNHTNDTLTIEALGDHWYQVTVSTHHRYCTLNISRGSDNLTESHPMWGKALIADISDMTLHLELKDLSINTSNYYMFTYALSNEQTTVNLTEQLRGDKETYDFTKSFGTGEGNIGAIGCYVDNSSNLTYKIRLTAY
jgi:hypothetical protein